MSRQKPCSSTELHVDKLAELLHETFVKEEKYGPVDKLALASSREALLVALYEVTRGLKSSGVAIDETVERAISTIIRDAVSEECLDDALDAAKMVAIKALSHAKR